MRCGGGSSAWMGLGMSLKLGTLTRGALPQSCVVVHTPSLFERSNVPQTHARPASHKPGVGVPPRCPEKGRSRKVRERRRCDSDSDVARRDDARVPAKSKSQRSMAGDSPPDDMSRARAVCPNDAQSLNLLLLHLDTVRREGTPTHPSHNWFPGSVQGANAQKRLALETALLQCSLVTVSCCPTLRHP